MEAFLAGLSRVDEAHSHKKCIELIDEIALLQLIVDRRYNFIRPVLQFLTELPNTMKTFPGVTTIVLYALQLRGESKDCRSSAQQLSFEVTKASLSQFLIECENKFTEKEQLTCRLKSDASVQGFVTELVTGPERKLKREDFIDLYELEIKFDRVVAKHLSGARHPMWNSLLKICRREFVCTSPKGVWNFKNCHKSSRNGSRCFQIIVINVSRQLECP